MLCVLFYEHDGKHREYLYFVDLTLYHHTMSGIFGLIFEELVSLVSLLSVSVKSDIRCRTVVKF